MPHMRSTFRNILLATLFFAGNVLTSSLSVEASGVEMSDDVRARLEAELDKKTPNLLKTLREFKLHMHRGRRDDPFVSYTEIIRLLLHPQTQCFEAKPERGSDGSIHFMLVNNELKVYALFGAMQPRQEINYRDLLTGCKGFSREFDRRRGTSYKETRFEVSIESLDGGAEGHITLRRAKKKRARVIRTRTDEKQFLDTGTQTLLPPSYHNPLHNSSSAIAPSALSAEATPFRPKPPLPPKYDEALFARERIKYILHKSIDLEGTDLGQDLSVSVGALSYSTQVFDHACSELKLDRNGVHALVVDLLTSEQPREAFLIGDNYLELKIGEISICFDNADRVFNLYNGSKSTSPSAVFNRIALVTKKPLMLRRRVQVAIGLEAKTDESEGVFVQVIGSCEHVSCLCLF